jgi:hypothetical protein
MSRWRWLLGIVFICVVAVTTWGQPEEESVAAARAAEDVATEDVGVRGSDPTVVASGPRVASPWQPGRPELGVHIYWEDNPLDDAKAVRRKAQRVLDQVVGMEANSVAVSFPFFVDSISASTVRTDARTPTPARIAVFLQEARRSGLRTTLRPLLDQSNLENDNGENVELLGWRGTFSPADRPLWFTSYTEFLVPYLQVAQSAGADTVVIGAELSELQDDRGWASVVEIARRHYGGQLGYSANWDAYPSAAGMPVDVVGVDAYPYLGLHPWASDLELAAAWRTWLDTVAGGRTNGLVLSEVGGVAERELVYNPAAYHTPGERLDERMQRRWFEAACQAARDRDVPGFYWWKLDFHVDPALADPDRDRHDSFLGREAEDAARDCFESWESVR